MKQRKYLTVKFERNPNLPPLLLTLEVKLHMPPSHASLTCNLRHRRLRRPLLERPPPREGLPAVGCRDERRHGPNRGWPPRVHQFRQGAVDVIIFRHE